jgi:hypothetical protein
MAKKVDVEQVEFTMQSVGIPAADIQKVIADLEQALVEEDEAKEKKPRVKKTVFGIARTDKPIPSPEETPLLAVQAPEELTHVEVEERFYKACYAYNANHKSGQKNPVKEVFDAVGATGIGKFFKEQDIKVLTKEPINIIPTDNQIPTS